MRQKRFRILLVLAIFFAGCAELPVGYAQKRDDTFGVLVMAHGGSAQWNDGVLSAVDALRDRYAIEVAFGMADAASLEEGVRKLEAQGVRDIGVVRLFISGESWYERTEQILGIKPGAPARPAAHAHESHEGHSMAFWKIETRSSFALSREGLAEAQEIDAVLADRVRSLSRNPHREDVLILAHGPGDDAENERWIAQIAERAQAIKTSAPFRRVEVQTLREDWPEKRAAAEVRARAFVQDAAASNGTAIVIPFRVQGFGPYARVLDGLDYVSDGVGLLPHANVTQWIERQAAQLQGQMIGR